PSESSPDSATWSSASSPAPTQSSPPPGASSTKSASVTTSPTPYSSQSCGSPPTRTAHHCNSTACGPPSPKQCPFSTARSTDGGSTSSGHHCPASCASGFETVAARHLNHLTRPCASQDGFCVS